MDRIVEVAISANLATDGAVLAPYGTIATYGAPDGPLPPSRDLIAKNARIDFVLVYTMPDEAKRDAVAEITEALTEGTAAAAAGPALPAGGDPGGARGRRGRVRRQGAHRRPAATGVSGFDPTRLPSDLPVPADDGAAEHLVAVVLPDVTLPATDGSVRAAHRARARAGP